MKRKLIDELKEGIDALSAERNMSRCMSDINWRDISEDQSLFEKENRNREILIETSDNHSMHFSKACYVLSYPYPYMDGSIQQPVARYAYID